MKVIGALLAGLAIVAGPAAASAQGRGGLHGGGFHGGGHWGGGGHWAGGGWRGGGWGGWHGWRGGWGYGWAPFWGGFALGFAYDPWWWGYPYPWYGYYGWPGVTIINDYPPPAGYADPWSYNYGTYAPSAGDQTCGQWVWSAAASKYNWVVQPCPPPGPAGQGSGPAPGQGYAPPPPPPRPQ